MQTWHIHITGQVQGVGFRPFVYGLALQYGLTGWVNNSLDGVHVEVNCTDHISRQFLNDLLQNAPAQARITGHHISLTTLKSFEKFEILRSDETGNPVVLITPDIALCDNCYQDVCNDKNRRQDYAFTTCTHCGPRYSILQELPYDRENTTMAAYSMCAECNTEYLNPLDRRYFSQTNSCPACGIQLALWSDGKQLKLTQNEILQLVTELWRDGHIIAIKGIGGYLLTCDAQNTSAIHKLRSRKHRPTKPFAVMYPDMASVHRDFYCTPEEEKALLSSVAPIVILRHSNKILPDCIAPHLAQTGVMLPYTPLHAMLLKSFNAPVIATSGNISNAPIVFQDTVALTELSKIADYVLVNDREIVIPQDDSVVQISPVHRQQITLRRSRGLAPTFINPGLALHHDLVFAAGAMLKSTFSFWHRGNTYISPYIGDLEHFATQESYRISIQHFSRLLHGTPEVILCDEHPDYPSSQYAADWGKELHVTVYPVQHHLAHFSAILGEHNLINEGPILGVIWDGTGLGQDGQIWGGEFFLYDDFQFTRNSHFEYFDAILGDKMAREPRISAMSACCNIMGAADVLENKFSFTEWQVYSQLLGRKGNIQTSSVGRLFDAVASLLGLMDKQTYEGEGAMRLESLAHSYFNTNGLAFSAGYLLNTDDIIPTQMMMTGVIEDIKAGLPSDFISAKFHYSLVRIIKNVAESLEVETLAFSGGVFQNSVLVDLIMHHLGSFKLCFHQELSPNDENISFGQLVYYQIQQHQNIPDHNTEEYVLSYSG